MQPTTAHKSCIKAVTDMRSVPKRIYTMSSWRDAVLVSHNIVNTHFDLTFGTKGSGLNQLLCKIGEPGIDLLSESGHIREQSIWCRWKRVLTEIHSRWTPIPLDKHIAFDKVNKFFIYHSVIYWNPYWRSRPKILLIIAKITPKQLRPPLFNFSKNKMAFFRFMYIPPQFSFWSAKTILT